jgi:hypothetical protein
VIVYHDRAWWLTSRPKGKRGKVRVLGVHETFPAALAQERAINIAKARRAGHKIPRKKRRRS